MMKSWIVLGVGTIIADVIDAIYSNNEKIETIYLKEDDISALHIKRIYKKNIDIKNIKEFIKKNDYYCFGLADYEKKLEYLELVEKENLNFKSLVHSKAYLSESAKVGKGNFFGPGCVIAANVQVGDFNYFNRLSSVGHDTKIGNFNFFGPKTSLAGGNLYGSFNFMGIGSTTINDLKIEDSIVLGAGAVAVNNLKQKGTYIGIPAKLINFKTRVTLG